MSRIKYKDPQDRIDYEMTWSDFLGIDTIETSLWTVPAGLTKISDNRKITAIGNRFRMTELEGPAFLFPSENYPTGKMADGLAVRGNQVYLDFLIFQLIKKQRGLLAVEMPQLAVENNQFIGPQPIIHCLADSLFQSLGI